LKIIRDQLKYHIVILHEFWHFDGNSWNLAEIPIYAEDPTIIEYPIDLWVAAHNSVIVSLSRNDQTGRTLYYDGKGWLTLSNEIGPQTLWGFVNE
jgi:hypothetical protein